MSQNQNSISISFSIIFSTSFFFLVNHAPAVETGKSSSRENNLFGVVGKITGNLMIAQNHRAISIILVILVSSTRPSSSGRRAWQSSTSSRWKASGSPAPLRAWVSPAARGDGTLVGECLQKTKMTVIRAQLPRSNHKNSRQFTQVQIPNNLFVLLPVPAGRANREPVADGGLRPEPAAGRPAAGPGPA